MGLFSFLKYKRHLPLGTMPLSELLVLSCFLFFSDPSALLLKWGLYKWSLKHCKVLGYGDKPDFDEPWKIMLVPTAYVLMKFLMFWKARVCSVNFGFRLKVRSCCFP